MKISILNRITTIVFFCTFISCDNSINTADELIDAHIEALGGYKALKALHTITIIGPYEENNFKQVLRFDKKRPFLIRVTINYNEQTGSFAFSEGFDGAAWEYRSKIPVRVVGEPSKALNNASLFEKTYIDYKRKGHKAELKGIINIKGIDVYHLVIIREGGEIDDYFFDVNTLTESISIGNVPFHGEGASIEIFEKRSDYRPVAGILMAFKVESISGDKILSTWTISKIEINKLISDEWFSPPLAEDEKLFKEFREDILAGKFEQMNSKYDEYQAFARKQLNQKLISQINTYGYELISYERYQDAIEIFKMAIKYYSTSSNLHDSLGETYLIVGDTLNAIINYKKSVELNPNNDYGKKMLDRLSEFTNGLTF